MIGEDAWKESFSIFGDTAFKMAQASEPRFFSKAALCSAFGATIPKAKAFNRKSTFNPNYVFTVVGV